MTDIKAVAEPIAINLVKNEKEQWESAYAFVVEKVAFNMREVIRRCRKNYWGVYDEPNDPSGREKIWQHLTKQFVDFVVKNIDIDTKDINFRAKNDNAVGLTPVIRAITHNKLDEADFGEVIDLDIRQLAIDGTTVSSAELVNGKLKVHMVDLLNFYIDPTAHSIAETESVIERIVVPFSEFQRQARKGDWLNTDIKGIQSISKNDDFNASTSPKNSAITYVELFRRRGLAPKATLTGDSKDTDLVPTEIICSANNGAWTLHSVTTRKSNAEKGYEEKWYTRVHGRWYGEGVAERLTQYQAWYNENRGIRLNRARVTQLGLWLFRKGSGITPQMVSRLTVNGGLAVSDINNDVKQLPVQDASQASYTDDGIIYSEAQRTTGAFDSVAGEPLPASTPATNAAIQQQAGVSGFTLIRKGICMGFQRMLKNQILPLILDDVTLEDVVRMNLDPENLRALDELDVNKQLLDQMRAIEASGGIVNTDEAEMERQRALASYEQMGKERFVKILHSINVTDYDVEVVVGDEKFNPNVLVQQIGVMTQILGSLGLVENVIELTRQQADLMGLDGSRIKMPKQVQMPGQQAAESMNPATASGGNPKQQAQTGSVTDAFTPANTMEPSNG